MATLKENVKSVGAACYQLVPPRTKEVSGSLHTSLPFRPFLSSLLTLCHPQAAQKSSMRLRLMENIKEVCNHYCVLLHVQRGARWN